MVAKATSERMKVHPGRSMCSGLLAHSKADRRRASRGACPGSTPALLPERKNASRPLCRKLLIKANCSAWRHTPQPMRDVVQHCTGRLMRESANRPSPAGATSVGSPGRRRIGHPTYPARYFFSHG
jgi:hypothetical protein